MLHLENAPQICSILFCKPSNLCNPAFSVEYQEIDGNNIAE